MTATHPSKTFTRVNLPLRIFLSLLLTYLLPILLDRSGSPWLAFSYTKDRAIFEYLGFAGTCCLLVNFAIEWKRRTYETVPQKLFLIAISLFAAYQLLFFSELSLIGNDYLAYQESVRAILAHQSPYVSPYTALHRYIYPPLLAQAMTFAYRLIRWIWFHGIGQALGEREIYSLLFYTYQFVQLCLVLLSFTLAYRLARRLRLEPIHAVALVSGLFLFNLPLYRNFSLNQVNLWILASLLLAMLWIEQQPYFAGIVIAVGTHLKLYPVIQLLPWLLRKKWRALLAFGAAFLGILVIEIASGRGLHLWLDFFQYLGRVEKGYALRNNSLNSLAYNLTRLAFWGQSERIAVISTILTSVLTIGLGGWVLLRMFWRSRQAHLDPAPRLLGMMMDGIFLMFFISPSVWDHHLVAAIPLVIWAFARFPRQHQVMIDLAAVCIFLFPTFDVFFFSYFRLFGLILLLYSTDPSHEMASDWEPSSQS